MNIILRKFYSRTDEKLLFLFLALFIKILVFYIIIIQTLNFSNFKSCRNRISIFHYIILLSKNTRSHVRYNTSVIFNFHTYLLCSYTK